jgi:hypothetical protein
MVMATTTKVTKVMTKALVLPPMCGQKMPGMQAIAVSMMRPVRLAPVVPVPTAIPVKMMWQR